MLIAAASSPALAGDWVLVSPAGEVASWRVSGDELVDDSGSVVGSKVGDDWQLGSVVLPCSLDQPRSGVFLVEGVECVVMSRAELDRQESMKIEVVGLGFFIGLALWWFLVSVVRWRSLNVV